MLVIGIIAGYSSVPSSRTEMQTSTVEKQVTVYKTITIQPTPTIPEASVSGTSKLNPIPFGEKLVIEDWEFWIIDVERDVYDKIKEMSILNPEPEMGKEAILVKLGAKWNTPPTERLEIIIWWFGVVGENGVIYEPRHDVVEPKLTQEIFGGTTIEGYISFDVAEGEQDLVLVLYEEDNMWYMALT
jgi:hypothetical protein